MCSQRMRFPAFEHRILGEDEKSSEAGEIDLRLYACNN